MSSGNGVPRRHVAFPSEAAEHAVSQKTVSCVATALVAAVIAQFVFYPSGALENFPFTLRIGAALAGFFAFLFLGRRMFVCIVVGEAVLLGGYFLV